MRILNMNIFLDTTLTFPDPYLREGYTHSLLKLAKEYKDIKLYMSEVVYQETERHFKKNLDDKFQEIRKLRYDIESYKPSFGYIEKNSIDHELSSEYKYILDRFKSIYENFEKEGLLQILSCPNDFLPELINRSVNRIKPFKEGKSEFRDAVTWLTYVELV